jgi:alpha-galactosidase
MVPISTTSLATVQHKIIIFYKKICSVFLHVVSAQDKYPTMSQALQATGRPMVFSICEWGLHNPGAWAQSQSLLKYHPLCHFLANTRVL